MEHDQLEDQSQQEQNSPAMPVFSAERFLPRLRAFLSTLPEVRLAYFQPTSDDALDITGPDRPRVLIVFSRNVSTEHVEKRMARVRKQFKALVRDEVEFINVEQVDYREACEVAFNAIAVYGNAETVERDRLYRYNVFLEWNASKRVNGSKQLQPPSVLPSLERPASALSVPKFVTPIYRHLKLIDSNMRALTEISQQEMNDFVKDSEKKSLAESYMLKSIQSAILITMSAIHRKVRLNARDYRDLFLLMPLYGIATRDRAHKLARCADIRDRLMFQYEEVTPMEVYQNALEVLDTLQDFKTFIIEWVFDNYYAASGELVQGE